MQIIGIIVVVIIIISVISSLLSALGEFAEKIIGFIVGGALLVGAFFLLKFLFGVIGDWAPIVFGKITSGIQFLFCQIPRVFIYGYITIFALLMVLGIVSCMLKANIEMVIVYVLNTTSMIGSQQEIKKAVEKNIENDTSGITKFMAMLKNTSSVYNTLIQDNCISLSSKKLCTVAVANELSMVLSEMGMATDKELMLELESREIENSEALNEICGNIRALKKCFNDLKKREQLTIEPIPFDENIDCIEKKLYKSTKPIENASNALPTQHFTIA